MNALRHPSCIAVLVLLVTLAGCSQFPELDDNLSSEARAARYPDLVPVEDLRAGLTAPRITDETTTTLEGRVAALRARAARLRGTVIDRNSRNRLEQKVTLPDPA
ncbi:MAG: hypothetical protein AAFW87_11020 [Pseudomonadota bacterium]